MKIFNPLEKTTANLTSKQYYAMKVIFFLIPFVIVALLIILKIYSFEKYRAMVLNEDGFIENFTALLYFLSFIISILMYFDLKRNDSSLGVFLLILAICFLFICMEEINYGQRVFKIGTPSLLKAINKQRELNLHNTLGRYPLHFLYILTGLYGISAKLIIQKILKFKHRMVDYITPDYFLISYFFPVFILYIYYDYLSPILIDLYGDQFIWARHRKEGSWLHAKDQEAAEFILSLGFFLFTLNIKIKHILSRKT